jgi:hypothetical protein
MWTSSLDRSVRPAWPVPALLTLLAALSHEGRREGSQGLDHTTDHPLHSAAQARDTRTACPYGLYRSHEDMRMACELTLRNRRLVAMAVGDVFEDPGLISSRFHWRSGSPSDPEGSRPAQA